MDAKIGAALKENPELVVTDTGPGYKMLDNPRVARVSVVVLPI